MRIRQVHVLVGLGSKLPAHGGWQLGTYEFTGDDQTGDALVPTFAGLSYTPFVRTGVLPQNADNAFNSKDWSNGAVLDASEFVSFSVTVAASFTATIEQFDFRAKRSPTGPDKAAVRPFANGGFSSASSTTNWPRPHLRAKRSILPTSFLAARQTREVRFGGYGATTTAGTLRFDDVALTGTVAPLPSAAVGGGLLCTALLAWRVFSRRGTGARRLSLLPARSGVPSDLARRSGPAACPGRTAAACRPETGRPRRCGPRSGCPGLSPGRDPSCHPRARRR